MLTPNAKSGENSDKKRVTDADLDEPDLVAGNEVTVYEEQVPADFAYHWGYGFSNREAGQTSFVDFDFQNSAGNAIQGELVLAITDSSQEEVLAKRYFESLGDLRDSVASDRTEKILMPEMQPAAREDRHLELRINADSGSDGDTVSSANSDGKLNYGRIRR
jgi:hypothetical protein